MCRAAVFLAAMFVCYLGVRSLYDEGQIAQASAPVGNVLRGVVWSYFPVAALWYASRLQSRSRPQP